MNSQTDIIDYFQQGHKEVIVTRQNGDQEKLRLFMSSGGALAYYGKGMRRRGYSINNLQGIISVRPVTTKKPLTVKEKYLSDLNKFKTAFSEKCHPNLWGNIQNSYRNLDIEKFGELIDNNQTDTYTMYKVLCDFIRDTEQSHVITENRYKTTTIKSNKPKNSYSSEYRMCLENITNHLEKKENFHYYWESSYDVSVEGKLCEDGLYRAWLNLEYRGCGNGHYYLLINENLAVFAEDD